MEGGLEGRIEGGKAKALLIQIKRKFGSGGREAYQARVERATPNEFEVWGARILDADRVEELNRAV